MRSRENHHAQPGVQADGLDVSSGLDVSLQGRGLTQALGVMKEGSNGLVQKLALLNQNQKLSFFEVLAHNLTVSARGAWSDENLSPIEQVEALKRINECLHRVTARIRVQRLNEHEWSDESFCSLLTATDESLHRNLQGCIAAAAWRSYELASHDAQPGVQADGLEVSSGSDVSQKGRGLI